MKIFINTTEDWKEIKNAVKNAEKILSKFDIEITLNKIDLDLSHDLFYETKYSWDWLKLKKTKSLKNEFIRNLGRSHGGDDYSYYGLIVDKNKTQEEDNLYGQHSSKYGTIEVYAKKTKRKYWGLDYTTYNLVHELLHAIASFNDTNDTLHEYLKENKTLDKYIDKLYEEVCGDNITWNWVYKHGPEIKPKCYILHTDIGTEKGTLDWLENSGKSISYNYYVNKKGEVTELVPFGYEAWHSGVVFEPTEQARKFFGNKNPNSMSCGICFEGKGEDANELQKEAIKKLIEEHGLMPIFAHIEITSHKPQAPLNLKLELLDLSKNAHWFFRLLAALRNKGD